MKGWWLKSKGGYRYLFSLAELESSRAGKIGMEVGSLREKVIVALLIYKFGEANVETDIPITQPEVDVRLFGQPVSIKTFTSKGFAGVKLIWTVDARKAREFRQYYYPFTIGIIIRHISSAYFGNKLTSEFLWVHYFC